MLLPRGLEGSSNLTGVGAKLDAFDGAAVLFTAMFATGDLGEAACKNGQLASDSVGYP